MTSLRRAIGPSFLALLFLAPGAVGCGPTSGNTAGGAVAALATGIAIAGANRAVTGDCWGRCSTGYICNRSSGLCEAGECRPACDPGTYCAVTSVGYSCTATSTSYLGPQRPTGVPLTPEGDYRVQKGDAELREPDPSRTDSSPGRSKLGQVQIEKGNPGPVGQVAPTPTSPGPSPATPPAPPTTATPGPIPTPAPVPTPAPGAQQVPPTSTPPPSEPVHPPEPPGTTEQTSPQ